MALRGPGLILHFPTHHEFPAPRSEGPPCSRLGYGGLSLNLRGVQRVFYSTEPSQHPPIILTICIDVLDSLATLETPPSGLLGPRIPSIWHMPGTEEASASVQMTLIFMDMISSEPHRLPEGEDLY